MKLGGGYGQRWPRGRSRLRCTRHLPHRDAASSRWRNLRVTLSCSGLNGGSALLRREGEYACRIDAAEKVGFGPLAGTLRQALGAFGVSAAVATVAHVAVAALRQRPVQRDEPTPMRARTVERCLSLAALTLAGVLTFGNGGAAGGLAFGFGFVDLLRSPELGPLRA